MSLNTYKPQDELTIRDLLNILWKRKVWIIALVVIAVILSGALSLFVMKKEYRANATLSVTPKDVKPIALTEKITIDDPFDHLTKKLKADYVKGMLSPEVLTAVSGELGLNDTPSELLSRISVRDVEKSNLVEISVAYSDPGTAEKIANALCGIVEKSVQTERQAEFDDALVFAQGRLEVLKNELVEDNTQKDIFLDQHDVEAMMKEAVRLKAVADNYEDRLRTISRQISIDAAFVEALQEAYEGLGYVPAGNIEFDVSTSREVSSGGNRPNFEVSGDELSEALLVADYSAAHLRLISYSLEKTALESELVDIEARMDTIEEEVLALRRGDPERKKKYAQYKALQRLDDFIDGKITHYAIIPDYRYQKAHIMAFSDAKDSDETRYNRTRLLCLFGKSDGNLAWGLNHYTDWSGGSQNVIPCTSYEQALDCIREYVTGCTDKEPSEGVVDTAKKYGIELPVAYVAQYYKNMITEKQETIYNNRKAIEVAEIEIENIKAKLTEETSREASE